MALEREFEEDMFSIYKEAKALGYVPVIFKQMLDKHGGLLTAKKLLATDKVQYGLDRLYDLHRLDISMEAHVILPKYKSLFEDWEIAEARKRLDDRRYFDQ